MTRLLVCGGREALAVELERFGKPYSAARVREGRGPACHRDVVAHCAINALTRSRTITKDQVEEACRAGYEEYFDGLIGCAEEPWDRLPEQHRERLVRAQIAAARAFGLTVEGE